MDMDCKRGDDVFCQEQPPFWHRVWRSKNRILEKLHKKTCGPIVQNHSNEQLMFLHGDKFEEGAESIYQNRFWSELRRVCQSNKHVELSGYPS